MAKSSIAVFDTAGLGSVVRIFERVALPAGTSPLGAEHE